MLFLSVFFSLLFHAPCDHRDIPTTWKVNNNAFSDSFCVYTTAYSSPTAAVRISKWVPPWILFIFLVHAIEVMSCCLMDRVQVALFKFGGSLWHVFLFLSCDIFLPPPSQWTSMTELDRQRQVLENQPLCRLTRRCGRKGANARGALRTKKRSEYSWVSHKPKSLRQSFSRQFAS